MDSEIERALNHERELRERLEKRVDAMQRMDRWRWLIGIALGLALATNPQLLPLLESLLK